MKLSEKEFREREKEINRRKEEEENMQRDRSKRRDKSHDGSEREHLDYTGSTGFDIAQSPSVPVSEIEFNTKSQRLVYRGECIDKKSSGCIVHNGFDKESGRQLAIHEWTIPCPGHWKYRTDAEQEKVSKYHKVVKAVEQELHSLLELSHINLINYLAIRYFEEEDHIHVGILQEFVSGINLGVKISANQNFSLSEVQMITEQLLNTLAYLHSHSVVHNNLKASSVFLDSRGLVRLADYSIEKRLADLYKESHIEQPGVTFADDPIPAGNGEKGDILKLGMLVLSLVRGQHVLDYPPDIPTKLPSAFRDFLSKCLAVEDHLGMTASELLEHAFLKPIVSDGPEVGPERKNGSEQNGAHHDSESESDGSDPHSDPISGPVVAPQILSRIDSEFEGQQSLGKGGFGDVVQVRNKLDRRFYAIKKILLDPRRPQLNKKIIREVKLLSRLNHENVVRYYYSWIETLVNPDEVSSETTSIFNTTSKTSDIHNINSLGMMDDEGNNAPLEEESFTNVGDVVHPDEESVLFEEDDAEKTTNSDDSTDTKPTTETTTDESSLGNVSNRYLYIQMEFCEKSTLREAINEGLCNDKTRMWRLLQEILDGLVHIHKQGIIHRDLKPQNIFLDRNDHSKIGDFGLATSHTMGTADTASALDLASSKSEGGDSAMTGHIGTALYVAPEVNKVGTRTTYNEKVDIYSLGIILFEMCYAGFQTEMERIKVLDNMRLEEIKFPENFRRAETFNLFTIIGRCLKHVPEQRPTVVELLHIVGIIGESEMVTANLLKYNALGIMMIVDFQQKINAVYTTNPFINMDFALHGHGHIFQKAYLELLIERKYADPLKKVLPEYEPRVTYHMINRYGGEDYTNAEGQTSNAVRWGIFPGKEVVQSRVVDTDSFIVRSRDEALWELYEGGDYYLVNLVDNDFTKESILWSVLDDMLGTAGV